MTTTPRHKAVAAYQQALAFAPTRQQAIRDAQKLLTRASYARRFNQPELEVRRTEAAVALLKWAGVTR